MLRRTSTIAWLAALVAAILLAGPARAQDTADPSEADLQFEFAEQLFEIKVHKTAAAEYRRFLRDHEKDPRREEARYKLVLCHAKLGGDDNNKTALAELATVRKEFPNGKRLQDALFRSGHIRYVSGDGKGAVRDLGELAKLEVRPDLLVQTHHFLGRAHYDLGQHAQALEHLLIVAAAPRKNELRPFALVVLADLYLKTGKPAENAAILEKLLTDYPKLPLADEMRAKLGNVLLSLKHFERAQAAYGGVPANSTYSDVAAVGRARALLGLKKYPDAIKTCETVLAGFKETPASKGMMLPEQCTYIIGLAHFNQSQFDKAADAFARLLDKVRQGPMAEDAAHKLCWCRYRQGPKVAKQLVTACVTFRRSFPASRWTAQVVFLSAEGHLTLGDYANATAEYKQIAADDPNYADALYRIAYCHHKQGKHAEAAGAYDAFLTKFGRHEKAAGALIGAAGLYQAAGRFEDAADRYARYLALAPKGPGAEEAVYQRGVCFAKMSRFDDMAAAFQAYTKQFPNGTYAARVSWWLGRHYRIRADALAEEGTAVLAANEYAAAIAAFAASAAKDGANKDPALLAVAECAYNLGRNEAGRAAAIRAELKDAAEERKAELTKTLAALEPKATASLRRAANGFRDIIIRRPDLAVPESVYLWTGTHFREQGDPATAIQIFKAHLKKFKEAEKADTALYQLARLHGELDPPDRKAVIGYCDTLLARHANSPFALQATASKADALYDLRKYAAAEKLYREVSQKGTGALKIRAELKRGHIGIARKEYAAAARHFARVGLPYHDPEFASEGLYYAGKANDLLGDEADAVKFWKRLLERYPDSQPAAEARKELKRLGYKVGPNGAVTKE